MCGIAGFLNVDQSHDHDSMMQTLRVMTDSLIHRGPDDSDYWLDGAQGIALGHRRLSILDLSPAGRQPMVSACGRFRIVFNGEIYNFAEVRQRLIGSDHVFRGHSDTEILVEAVARVGLQRTLACAVGMFAIAVWDGKDRTLSLARDRMGEKPLYFGHVAGRFAFASELKSFRALTEWQRELNLEALMLYFRYGYVPGPFSVFRGISKLPPGTTLTVDARGLSKRPASLHNSPNGLNGFSPEAYWSLRRVAEQGLNNPIENPNDAIEELERLLGQSVSNQLIADVPLGAFLSAGIDSSTVVAIMQQRSRNPIKTFTIGFADKAFDEAEHAQAIATHLGTEHTELYVTESDILRMVSSLPTAYDEPFADSSQLPTMILSELVRKHVTVCLTGDGGDELFGGYNRYWWSKRLWRFASPFPALFRSGVGSAVGSLPNGFWDGLSRPMAPFLPKTVQGTQTSPAEKIAKMAEVFGSPNFEALYRNLLSYWKSPQDLIPGLVEPSGVISAANRLSSATDLVQQTFYWDQSEYLPDDNLVKVDRASMRSSLETRVPMLDHRIVEFSWRVPTSMKYRGGVGKWLLRQLLYRHVPQSLMERPKMGFSVPVARWLRGGLRDWAESSLNRDSLCRHGFLNPDPILHAWHDHLSGRRNMAAPLWTVLVLQSWLSTYG